AACRPARCRIRSRSHPAPRGGKDIPAARTCGRNECRLGFRARRRHLCRTQRDGGALMSVLLLAEHDNGKLSPATARLVAAASQLGEVDLLVVAENPAAIAEAASTIANVRKVLVVAGHSTADALALTLESCAQRYQSVSASASSVGKDVIPRLAAKLDI